MNGEEYLSIRKQLGLTQVELAAKLGVKELTIRRRETGKAITKEAEISIKLLVLSVEAKQAWNLTDCEYAGPTLESIWKLIN